MRRSAKVVRGIDGLGKACVSARKTLEAMQRAIDTDEWKRLDEIRNELERPVISEMDMIFQEQQREVIAALETFRSTIGEERTLFSLEALFNAPKWFAQTWSRLRNFFLDAILAGYEVGGLQGEVDLPDLTSFDPAVREQLEIMAENTSEITRTTAKDLAEIIDRALRNGTSVDDLAFEINDKFEGYTAHRSKLIAQTNITGAFGKGQKESFSRAGLDKRWLSQRDGSVRPTHNAADGQTRGANEHFEVGRALLQFPADPETDQLQEIMRCRCSMTPVRR